MIILGIWDLGPDHLQLQFQFFYLAAKHFHSESQMHMIRPLRYVSKYVIKVNEKSRSLLEFFLHPGRPKYDPIRIFTTKKVSKREDFVSKAKTKNSLARVTVVLRLFGMTKKEQLT